MLSYLDTLRLSPEFDVVLELPGEKFLGTLSRTVNEYFGPSSVMRFYFEIIKLDDLSILNHLWTLSNTQLKVTLHVRNETHPTDEFLLDYDVDYTLNFEPEIRNYTLELY